jgi:hypothetical protein
VCVVRQPVHLVHGLCQGRRELIACLRQHGPVEAGEEDRNAVVPHCLEGDQHALQNVPHLAERRLFIIQRVQKAENDRRAGVDGAQK